MTWNEVHFLVVASFFLLACASLRLVRPDWRLLERTLALVALCCIVAGLGYGALRRGAWPLPSNAETTPVAGGEWMVTTAGAALLWLLLNERGSRQTLGRDPCALPGYAMIGILLLWGMLRWNESSPLSATTSRGATLGLVPRLLWLMSSFTQVLAAGALVHVGSLAVCGLAAERLGKVRAPSGRQREEDAGYAFAAASAAALVAFPLLTASLLLSVAARLYTQGVYWDWAAVDSWRLLAWLFAASLWCGWTLLGWRGRRLQVLAVIGLALVLLMLVASGR